MVRSLATIAMTVVLLASAGCGGGSQDDGPSRAEGPPTSTEGQGDDEAGGDAIESTVSTDGSDVTSEARVRVVDILSRYSAVETSGGTRLTVPSRVLFDFDEAALRPGAKQRLDEIVEVLTYYEDAPATIAGHTDSVGSEQYNRELSQARAEAVSDHLTGAGVEGARLTTEGRGETDPVASNETGAGRQENRRVEILVEGVERVEEPE